MCLGLGMWHTVIIPVLGRLQKKKEDHKFKATLGDIVYSNMEGREEARKVREIEKQTNQLETSAHLACPAQPIDFPRLQVQQPSKHLSPLTCVHACTHTRTCPRDLPSCLAHTL